MTQVESPKALILCVCVCVCGSKSVTSCQIVIPLSQLNGWTLSESLKICHTRSSPGGVFFHT